MRPLDTSRALAACHAAAREIRAAAMDHGTDLDDEDRRGLFALAALIERKATARAMAHGIVSRAVDAVLDVADGMIGIMDALDAPAEDCEPWLGAPERCDWRNGYDQTGWSDGGTDDREDEDEHATDLDRGEVDDCPRPRRKVRARAAEALPVNVLPLRARAQS